jgi:hypothetical protein
MSATPETSLAVFLEQGRTLVRTVSASELIARAEAIVIKDDASFEEAGTIRSAIKGAQKNAEDRFKRLRDPLNTLRAEIIGMENDVVGPLELAVRDLDKRTTSYRQEQIRLAEEKRRADEAAARKIEEDRRLKEAEAARASGVPEAEALAIMDEPLMPIMAPPMPAVPKIAGQSYVDVWSAQVVDFNALLRYVAEDPGARGHMLAVNQPALNQIAKSMKASLKIPGVKAVCQQTVRGRAAG